MDNWRWSPKTLWGIALLTGAGICVFALFDPMTIPAWYRLQATARQLHEQVEGLRSRVQRLRRELALLAEEGQSVESADYLLRLARDELGFIEVDERVLCLPVEKRRQAAAVQNR
ncbi:MAG: septum formation initiator family protein [Myxococcota bacterium]